jgi:hypothetical protein
MTASTPAAYDLKGLPSPTGRGIHRRVSSRSQGNRNPAQADGTRSNTFVLLLKGGSYLETGKHDSVGKVQPVQWCILATSLESGKATIHPLAQDQGLFGL